MSKKLLTLNIGAAEIELAEYEHGSKGTLKLLNYGVAPLAAPLDGGNAETILTPALLSLVREKGFKPGKLALAVPGQMVFPKFSAIPMAGGAEKFEQMIRYEIEQTIPFPIDEMVCDRQVLGDTENGDKAVMIVAAKVDQIEEITSAVVAAGFTPELVDVSSLAVTNVLELVNPGLTDPVVILDIGAKTSSLIIIEGEKLYNRSIPVAGNNITREIASALNCTQEDAERLKLEKAYVSMGGVTEDEDPETDAIAKICRTVMTRINAEVSRSINFYRGQQHGNAPVRLYLTGGTALLPNLDQFFAESLNIEVEFLNPFVAIEIGSKVDASALEMDAALLGATAGLAMHAQGTSKLAINLLPPSLVNDKIESARVPIIVAGGLLAAVGLALLIFGFGREKDSLVAQCDAVQGRVTKLQNFERKVTAADNELKAELESAETLRKLMVSRAVAVQSLNAVKASLLPGMWIDKWEPNRISIRGWKDSVRGQGGKTAGELVVDALKRKAAVDPESVKISDMSTVGKDGQIEQFTLELKFK